jgi:Domain of unknown function (DUF5666)
MQLLRYVATVSLVAAVTACGGGGVSSVNNSPTTAKAAATTATGTISGFGSVVINGKHYDTSAASFTVDDASANQSGLHVGQLVTVSGKSDDSGATKAEHVDYDSAVVGAITVIDSTNNSLTALGQTIKVGVSTAYENVTDFSALQVGDFVRVSGDRDSAGNIVAGYIGKLPASPAEVRLSGPIATLNSSAGTFTIGGEAINFGSAALVPANVSLQSGQFVVVRGTVDSAGTTLTASRVRVRKPLQDANPGDHGELEGLISQTGSNTFQIGTVVVHYDSSTVFEHGSASDVAVGRRVEVHGLLNSDGSLQAQRVEIEVAEREDRPTGVLVGVLTSSPDTTTNTIALLGTTVAVTSNTVYEDDNDQMFKLSDLMAGDRVGVAVTPSPSGATGPALTALKITHPHTDSTASTASGPFGNANSSAKTLSAETIPVAGSTDCPSGSKPAPGCTLYSEGNQVVTGSQFFQDLSNPQYAQYVVLAVGSYDSTANKLNAQALNLREKNQSGDDH